MTEPQSAPSSARLSILIVAHNEERDLPGCLASAAFADEVVVVLDRSTDGSKAICAAAGAVIVEGAWPIEGPRRHAGIDACAGPWILELDADERVTPALARELREILQDAAPGAWLVPIENYIGTRKVRYGWGAYNGVPSKWSLFTKGSKSWGDQRVHPATRLDGARGRLVHPIVHYDDSSLTDTFARLNRYSELAAADLADAGRAPSGLATFRRMITRFWKSYVSRGGWREGFYGVALGTFSALYPLFVYLKVRELKLQRTHS